MRVDRLTPILNVSDLAQSFEWFEKLGWQKGWDWGNPATFGGDDVDAVHKRCLEQGIEETE